jgi:hypothetical protein
MSGKKFPPNRDLKRVSRFEADAVPIDLYADDHGAVLVTQLPDGRIIEWFGILRGPSREL